MISMKCCFSAIISYRNYSNPRYAQNRFRAIYTTKYEGLKDPRGCPNLNPSPLTSIKWTDEQSKVLSAIANGKSVFITGSAGCGKTVLLNHAVELLKVIHGASSVFVTASTGVAACALHGQTLHSFAGVGLGLDDKETLLHKVRLNKKALQRWKKTKALVIDEISMVNAGLFESLEFIARNTRPKSRKYSREVWAGIQVIVTGDFLQLAPINKKDDKSEKIYAFEADCWDSSFDLQIELTAVFRQTDKNLVKLLQGIRRGETDEHNLKLLKQCCTTNDPDPSMVRLYPRIEDVNKVNSERMNKLKEEIVTYSAHDTGSDLWKSQFQTGLAPDVLELCIGARVMLTKNLLTEEKLVNGATGTIIDFVKNPDRKSKTFREINCENLLPVVKFDSVRIMAMRPEEWEVSEGDIVHAKRTQIPLILAWALSIHKCQGMTLDSLHTDLSRAFGCGMVYVALSRVRTFEGLHLSGLRPSKIKADPKVLQFYQSLGDNQGTH